MADLDALAPNYLRAQQRWPDAPTLAKCHEALKACFDGNGHGMVEHVKSFIESVCLTIMGEFREPMSSSTPSTTELLVSALSPLGLRNSRGANKLDKILSGFNKLADALSDMRNETGPLAHGKDGFLDAVTADHARAFLHTGDAIVGVLLNAFEGKQPDLIATREPYENFPHLNDRIDSAVNVDVRIDEDGDRPVVVFSVYTKKRTEAIEIRVEPSRLLYGVDRTIYVELLKTAERAVEEVVETDEEAEEAAVRAAVEIPAIPVAVGPVTELVPQYEGELKIVRVGVEAFLTAEGLDPTLRDGGGKQLIDSLLATAEQNIGLDWKDREPIQARLKVACKRVLVQFGIVSGRADSVAERLVAWLRVQLPDAEAGTEASTASAEGAGA
ncbi:MAG TPA: abortive infection family protein [Terriglobia bacterium]|jgi:hypothetical protein